MMKMAASITAGGIMSILLMKLFAAMFFPMLAMLMGFLAMTVKLGLIAAVVFFLYTVFRRRRDACLD